MKSIATARNGRRNPNVEICVVRVMESKKQGVLLLKKLVVQLACELSHAIVDVTNVQ